MATGDDAVKAGYGLVSGSDLVNKGDDAINETRDMIARVKLGLPANPGAYRKAAGISNGSSDPSGGADGDIYFKIVG